MLHIRIGARRSPKGRHRSSKGLRLDDIVQANSATYPIKIHNSQAPIGDCRVNSCCPTAKVGHQILAYTSKKTQQSFLIDYLLDVSHHSDGPIQRNVSAPTMHTCGTSVQNGPSKCKSGASVNVAIGIRAVASVSWCLSMISSVK